MPNKPIKPHRSYASHTPHSVFPQIDHDHGHCTSNLMSFAESFCQKSGLRFTKLRRDVLQQVAASHKAIGAYQILDNLALLGKNLAPISVYRSLDFLRDAGLIHRLESSNSYFACQKNFEDNDQCCSNQPLVFLICDECGTVGEVDGSQIEGLIQRLVKPVQFEVERSQLEIKGLCEMCKDGPLSLKTTDRGTERVTGRGSDHE